MYRIYQLAELQTSVALPIPDAVVSGASEKIGLEHLFYPDSTSLSEVARSWIKPKWISWCTWWSEAMPNIRHVKVAALAPAVNGADITQAKCYNPMDSQHASLLDLGHLCYDVLMRW